MCISSILENPFRDMGDKDALKALHFIGAKQGMAAIIKDNSSGPKAVDKLIKCMLQDA